MGAISLKGVESWSVGEYLDPGPYIVKAATVECTQSKSGNEQIQVDWRVLKGTFAGAEQRDWVTFTENAMGRVVQLIEACGQEVPQEDFKSFAELRDWVAGMLEKGAITEMIVRMEPGNKDPSKEFPKVAGYRKPSKSDLDNDASGFAGSPKVGENAEEKLPF